MAGTIDLTTFELPDVLTLPALAVALAGSLMYASSSGLPTPLAALSGAAAGAGTLALINRVGALVLRRFADTRERLWPVSLDQVNLAAVAGALGGWRVGLAVGAASVLLNLLTRRTLRLPEGPAYGLWAVALVLSATSFTVGSADALAGSVVAAGAWALLGAVYWWVHDLTRGESPQGAPATAPAGGPPHGETRPASAAAVDAAGRGTAPPQDDADGEPVAMGFGDVKLAAVLGALLGWQLMLVGLFLAVSIGALAGIAVRLAGGDRIIPFGPALLLGGLLALFFGHGIVAWYLSLLGV
jgi:leader peptidase (prepilin peptidase)/N-methyltransferase